MVQVLVRFNNIEYAIRNLKKKMQREGVFRVLKEGRFYTKPSVIRVRKMIETKRRIRKLSRRRFIKFDPREQ